MRILIMDKTNNAGSPFQTNTNEAKPINASSDIFSSQPPTSTMPGFSGITEKQTPPEAIIENNPPIQSNVNPISTEPLSGQQTQTSTEPPASLPPAGSISSPHVTTSSGGKKIGKFAIFIGILIVLTIVIYLLVGYFYLKNKNLKSQQQTSTALPTNTVNPEVQTSPTYSINNGDIQQESGTTQKIVVSKDNFPDTGITGFSKVTVSPDLNKICFEAWPPSTKPAIYLADSNGENAKEIAPGKKGCFWSPDSKKIAYVDYPSVEGVQNIFVYDLETQGEINTESNISDTSLKAFKIVSWDENSLVINCSYSNLGAQPSTTEQPCQINFLAKAS
jgi:hypothetical protein